MIECNHELYEREVACADGLCPLCLDAEVEALKSDIERHMSIAASLANEIEQLLGLLKAVSPQSTIITHRSYTGDWWQERDAALADQPDSAEAMQK